MASSIDLTLPPGVSVADHAKLAFTPKFWDPRKAYAWYSPDIEGAKIEGIAYRKQHGLVTADELRKQGMSNLLMLTDLQSDFRDSGRLPVQGTDDAILRACVRLLNGTVQDYYTDVVYSMDGHVPWHISYATRWQTKDGEPFDLREHKAAVLELINRDKAVFRATCFVNGSPIDMGPIQSTLNAKDTVDYWDHLETTGQGPIWVFANHCKIGTDGTNLHPLLAETVAFVEGARFMAAMPINKGHIRDTDWFGPLEPCRPDPGHPQGTLQKHILDMFKGVQGWVEFFGVAEDFCNYNMQKQVMDNFEGTDFFGQMAFATDGTAAIVPNTQHVTDLYAKARAKGVRFFTHDEPFKARV